MENLLHFLGDRAVAWTAMILKPSMLASIAFLVLLLFIDVHRRGWRLSWSRRAVEGALATIAIFHVNFLLLPLVWLSLAWVQDAYDALGIPHIPAGAWSGFPTWALVAILVTAGVLVAGYLFGVPVAARAIAERLPPSIAERLSDEVMKSLDGSGMTKPSNVPQARQDAIGALFAGWRAPQGETVPYRIVYRDFAHGANAFALPSGLIVVTDELVKLTDDDRLIAAVLAHELGHVKEKHGLRQAVQASIVSVVLAWWLGDVSSLIATLPTLLLQAKYSRELEQSADDYAARMLRANGLAPGLLADMLEKLEASQRPADGEPDAQAEAAGKSGDERVQRRRGKSPLDYLSSHPATRDRLARLRAL